MIKTIKAMAPWLLILAVLTACGQDQSGGGAPSYKEMKSMVVDILKTEEAQKAIEEVNKKQQEETGQTKIMQMLESPQGEQIQYAVKEVITDPSYPKILQDMMTDPKFAGEFAKAVMKENKEIHKELMKDPEYQTLLLETMKNPEFEKMFIEVMKSTAYRQQMMTTITEAIENPIFKLEMMKLLEKALEEQSKPKKEKGGGGSESESSGSDGGESEGGGS